jgi:ribosomal protein L32
MVVRMRHTRSHTANRRSHHALKSPALSKDATGEIHIRHRATIEGMYKGRSVLGDPVKKVLKKQAVKKSVVKKASVKKAVKKTKK